MLNNFLPLAAEDTQCKKAIVTLMCDAIVEAGLTAKSGSTETIVKQMTLTCGTTFMDALNKMVDRKQVIALFIMRRFAGMQPENLWRVCTYMALMKSTIQAFNKLAKEFRAGELWWHYFGHPACRLSASTLQDVCYCLVSPLPFVVRHCNATPFQWAAATGSLDEV